ncbi:MAG: hypothetical protein EZS28_021523 [Streblomastix strix]|uniref:Uncharacterized protein n=1 Tax=Streblomastix strix TaxID=222440 RepID=A0A5J4VK46_9EUKA|nr:MAG: hypothetical protein EZS28_021523 [Streblomastix strix]
MRLTKSDSTRSTCRPSCNINSLKTEKKCTQKNKQYTNSTNIFLSITTNFSNTIATLHNREKLEVEKEKISISSTRKTTDKSEEDNFQDQIILEIAMPYLPSHKIDVETAQQTWQNRRFDLVRDRNVIKLKNSKLRGKLATQKFFTFSNWREFWSDAGFSMEQINISHYLPRNTSLRVLTTSQKDTNLLEYMKWRSNMQQRLGKE